MIQMLYILTLYHTVVFKLSLVPVAKLTNLSQTLMKSKKNSEVHLEGRQLYGKFIKHIHVCIPLNIERYTL